MAIQYDEMGNAIGETVDLPSNVVNTATGTSTTNNVNSNSAPQEGDNRIRVLRYPMNGGNDHFVRFEININEESRLTRQSRMTTSGYVDNTDQNRANRNNSSKEAIQAGVAVAGAIKGTQLGAALSANRLKQISLTDVSKSMSYKAGANLAAVVATTAAAAGGAALGFAAGGLATDEFKLTNKLKKLTSTITLYTPGDIRVEYGMKYEITQDLLTDLAQQDHYADISANWNRATGPIESAKVLGSAAANVGKIGMRAMAASTTTGSLLSRTAVNKKKDVMFKEVDNRHFQFDYVFAPKSAEEAKEVADIIYMFKFFSHPEMLEGYGNFLYLYPAEFNIEYGMMVTDKDGKKTEAKNLNLNKISSCVLERISVNYAPNGSFQSLMNGEPIVTTLSLSFMEIEALHQGRIQKGF